MHFIFILTVLCIHLQKIQIHTHQIHILTCNPTAATSQHLSLHPKRSSQPLNPLYPTHSPLHNNAGAPSHSTTCQVHENDPKEGHQYPCSNPCGPTILTLTLTPQEICTHAHTALTPTKISACSSRREIEDKSYWDIVSNPLVIGRHFLARVLETNHPLKLRPSKQIFRTERTMQLEKPLVVLVPMHQLLPSRLAALLIPGMLFWACG